MPRILQNGTNECVASEVWMKLPLVNSVEDPNDCRPSLVDTYLVQSTKVRWLCSLGKVRYDLKQIRDSA